MIRQVTEKGKIILQSDRALRHYPREHYQHWKVRISHGGSSVAPWFHEFPTKIDEKNVFIGDITAGGDADSGPPARASPYASLNYQLLGIQDIAQLQKRSGKPAGCIALCSGQVSLDALLELALRLSEEVLA